MRLRLTGKHIPWLFAVADLATVNIVYIIFCLLYPQGGSAVMWTLVNVAMLPELWWGLRLKLHRALQLDTVARQALSDVAMHALFLLALMAGLGVDCFSLPELARFYGMMLAAFIVVRLASRALLKAYRRHGRGYVRVVIVGANSTGRRLAAEMTRDAGFGYRILGYFDDSCPEGFEGNYAGSLADLADFMRRHAVQQVYYCRGSISGSGEEAADVLRTADDCGAEFFFVPQLSRFVQRGMALETVGTMTVMGARTNPLSSRINRAVKRAFDLTVSGIFLCFYPLVYIPVAIAIKRSSPGPVYFRQERTGYHGRTFHCLKFRTMRVNADADSRQASKDDPRDTRWATSSGAPASTSCRSSSTCGAATCRWWARGPTCSSTPRTTAASYDRYMARHTVKPGITGWAQVTGWRGPTDQLWKMERRVEADVWYIEHWTLLLDLKIMARTVLNAIRGEENAL